MSWWRRLFARGQGGVRVVVREPTREGAARILSGHSAQRRLVIAKALAMREAMGMPPVTLPAGETGR